MFLGVRPSLPLLSCLFLAGACAPSDASLLALALSAARQGDDAAGAHCARLSDAVDRSWCAVQVVEVSPVQSRDIADCAQIETELWRSECYFVFAEEAAQRGQRDEALAHCVASHAMRVDCARHVWAELQLRSQTRSEADRAAIVHAIPESEPWLDAQEDAIAEQIWVDQRKLFVNSERIELSRCTRTPDPALCRRAAADVLAQRWRRAAKEPTVNRHLCALDGAPPDRPRLGWDPAPELDAAVAAVAAEHCAPSSVSRR